MDKKLFLAGMFSIVLTFGIMVISCDNETTGDESNSQKTLVITNISQTQANQGYTGISIGIFPTGTTPAQALAQTTIVAGGQDTVTLSGSSAPFTATAPLWAAPTFTNRWTGSGTYDIYLILGYSTYYWKQNVSFTSASTSVDGASFSVVTP